MEARLLLVSRGLDALLKAVAHLSAYALVALTGVIVIEIVTRKAGWQLPGLAAGRLFELQWHLGTVLFCGWMGYCYVTGAHVRIDAAAHRWSPRGRLRLEVAGCLLLAMPLALVLLWFTADFAGRSYVQNEMSDAPGGLPWRWVPKGVLVLGFGLVLLSVVSVLLKSLAGLLGGYGGLPGQHAESGPTAVTAPTKP